MDRSIILATDVAADRARVFEILSTTQGQRGFWTTDCEVSTGRARFGFPQAPVDLLTDVTTEPGKLIRMRVTHFPFWEGSTWEWELGQAARPQLEPGCYSATTATPTDTPKSTSPAPPRPGH
jgi:hypothetical protein